MQSLPKTSKSWKQDINALFKLAEYTELGPKLAAVNADRERLLVLYGECAAERDELKNHFDDKVSEIEEERNNYKAKFDALEKQEESLRKRYVELNRAIGELEHQNELLIEQLKKYEP